MIHPARREGRFLPPLAAFALALGLIAPAPAHAAPPAGSAVDNTASCNARDSLSGLAVSGTSNTVSVTVQPLEGLSLAPDRGGTGLPGATVLLRHELANRGNVASEVRLDPLPLPGGDFAVAAIGFVRDRDRDGTVSAGDTPVASGGTVTLAAGDSASLLVLATLPTGVSAYARARIQVTATTLGQGATAAVTDTLVALPAIAPPALAFFDGPGFARVAHATALGAPLWLQATAVLGDRDTLAADTLTVTLASRIAADQFVATLVETGPHTGVFRAAGVPVAQWSPGNGATQQNALLQARGDQITADLAGFGATSTRASVWVEPGGVVFDARTGATVAGAGVRLVDETGAGNGGVPGGDARVWQDDGTTPAAARVRSDGEGRFAFPLVAASTYRVEVTPPAPYAFPSQASAASLAIGHVIDPAGSWGGSFTIAEPFAPVVLDLPVDAHVPVVLFAEKTASPAVAEWGDGIEYRLRVANRSDSTLDSVRVEDALPAGFAFVPGSARLGTAALAVVADGHGHVAFAPGAMAPQAVIEIRYRARIGSGAPRGEATSAAQAHAGAVRSNLAAATVRVLPDAFADEGTIAGSVSAVDARGAVLAGLAGVRLWLDDGTWAVTDERGRFSFTNVAPRTHALKLDPVTLPAHAHPVALDHRDAGTPGLRFVDLVRGELAHADFAVAGDTTLREAAEQRRQVIAARAADERTRALALGFEPRPAALPTGDARALPAARIVTGESSAPALTAALAVARTPAPAAAAVPPLEARLASFTPEPGFVGIADLDTVNASQVTVTAKGRAGDVLTLRVNGEDVPASRIGRQLTAAAAGIEAREWIGVPLQPGVNALELASSWTSTPVRLRVVAPGALAKLLLVPPRGLPADGRSAGTLRLRAVDEAGVPVAGRTLVTLESGLAKIDATDLDPATPGVQVALDDGRADVALVAPATPGPQRLAASAGEVRGSALADFLPDLRPLMLVGAAEGVISLTGFPRRGPAGAADGASFEAPITQFASTSTDGALGAAAHGALFARGRVGERTLLTMGWNSDVAPDQRLFRDLQPGHEPPVVGDASTRGYEAQTTGQLYAKLEQPGASVLYGDFTNTGTGTRTLGNYSRSLTGATADWNRGRAHVVAFTSRTHSHRATVELPGNGTSGPYVIPHAPLAENSERIEIVTRDRAQPAVVVTSESRERFMDYELDPLTGRLLFRTPVPSVDADLNPVSVRVTYETEGDGEASWVHGVDARTRVSRHLEVGALVVDDHDPAAPFELRSASASAALGPHTALDAEWAGTMHPGTSALANAGRFELRHDAGGTQARVWGVATARGFDNPGAGVAGGRNESGARLSLRLPSRAHLVAEALRSADAAGRDVTEGALVAVDRPIAEALRGEFGVRVAQSRHASGVADEPASTALRGKLTLQLPRHPAWSGYGEFEQDTREGERRMAALGGEYRFARRGRFYARHELLSGFASPWALTGAQQQLSSIAGVDADLAGDTHLFGEYRLPQAIASRDAQAAVGLRNGWTIADGTRLGVTFERVTPLAGNAAGPSTAASASVDFTGNPQWRGSSRLEMRTSRPSDQYVQSMAAAIKVDSLWTALGRWLVTLTDGRDGRGEAQARLQVALARRGPHADALGRWELRYDGATAVGETRHVRVANIATLAGGARWRTWAGSLGWAGKRTMDRADGFAAPGGAQWLHGRVTRDLGRDWDAGVNAGVLTGARLSDRQLGLGIEVGRVLPGGTWLSVGANRFGFEDRELAGESWTKQGAYVRLRVKFDESLLRRDAGVVP